MSRYADVSRDHAGEWRYHVWSGGNQIDSSEGYTRRRDAVRAVKRNRPDVKTIRVFTRRGDLARRIELDG